MSDPLTSFQRLEVSGQLDEFQFRPTQRIYFCKDVTLTDNLTKKRIYFPQLNIILYKKGNYNKAEIHPQFVDQSRQGIPILLGEEKTAKQSKEIHKVVILKAKINNPKIYSTIISGNIPLVKSKPVRKTISIQ